MPINKKYVELKVNNKVVAILEVKECAALEFLQKQKEAQKNLEQLNGVVTIYKNRIKELEKQIKILKGEEE